MAVNEENDRRYCQFNAVDTATKTIVDYLVNNNDDLWKLLYYTKPNVLPLEQPNLTLKQKIKMICTDVYATNNNVDKNILFQVQTGEAFQNAIPQIRIEIGDIVPIDPYRGFMYLDFQIVVPNKQDLFVASYSNVARRSDAIFRELAKTLNGVYIPNTNFNGKLFMDTSAPNGAGRRTGAFRQQMNDQYTGRWVTFSVLVS